MNARTMLSGAVLPLLLLVALVQPLPAFELNDGHVHLTNYIQRGPGAKDLLRIMGDKVGRAPLFGLPVQQKWDATVSGNQAPTYYLHSDAELYYYSFTDAIIAEEYRGLTREEQARLDPMITGFNPTDMYATDHILRVLKMYPGVFTGIGEFSVNKEFVSSKIAGGVASLGNPALHRIFDLAGDVGLVVLLHSDISTVISPLGDRPAYYDDLVALFKAHPKTSIIWAHTGLGRIVKPTKDHVELLRRLLGDPGCRHVAVDISWDEVAKHVTADPETLKAWTQLIARFPDRFLFGTDSVAPANQEKYLKTYRDYQPLWAALDEETALKVRTTNYERIFDAARANVRAWERKSAAKQ